MCPNSRYFGLKVVPVWGVWGALWDQSIYYLSAWALSVKGLGFRISLTGSLGLGLEF